MERTTVSEKSNLKDPAESFKRQRRVLIVDDDPLIQLAMKSMATKLGCMVEKAENGKAAVELVRDRNKKAETRFDLVLMDVNMPVMNGYEASEKIRDGPGIIPVPIICVSAQDCEVHRDRCRQAGMDKIRTTRS